MPKPSANLSHQQTPPILPTLLVRMSDLKQISINSSLIYLDSAEVHWFLDDLVVVLQSQQVGVYRLIEWPRVAL